MLQSWMAVSDAVRAEVVVEVVVGRSHVDEQRVATDGRHFERAQDRGERGHGAEGAVGVPLVLVREHARVTRELDHVVDRIG